MPQSLHVCSIWVLRGHMRFFKVWLPHSSCLTSCCPVLAVCMSALFSIPSSFVLPWSLPQLDPSRSPEHSPSFSSPHPYNTTPHSFSFPLSFTLFSAHRSLRIKNSFGPSWWNLKCLNCYSCKYMPATTHCAFGAPSIPWCRYPTWSPGQAVGIQGCWVKQSGWLQPGCCNQDGCQTRN